MGIARLRLKPFSRDEFAHKHTLRTSYDIILVMTFNSVHSLASDIDLEKLRETDIDNAESKNE